jgi:hypothetical protein
MKILLLYTFLLCVIDNMLRMRYKALWLRIYNFLKKKSPVCDKNFLDFLDWVESTMNLLKNTVQICNSLFGGSICWIISFTTFHILNYTYNLLYNSSLYNSSHVIFYDVYFSLEFCKSRQASVFYSDVSFFQLVTSVLLLLCHSVTREAERIVSLCYGVKWRFEHVSKAEEEKFYQFGNFVFHCVTLFRAAIFF